MRAVICICVIAIVGLVGAVVAPLAVRVFGPPAPAVRVPTSEKHWYEWKSDPRVFTDVDEIIHVETITTKTWGFSTTRTNCICRQGVQPLVAGTRADIKAGWPTVCLEGKTACFFVARIHCDNVGVLEVRSRGESVEIPTHVVVSGLAINTACFTAMAGLPVLIWARVRRRRRIKRGLCPKCAYPVGGSDICTECGAAVKPRPQVS